MCKELGWIPLSHCEFVNLGQDAQLTARLFSEEKVARCKYDFFFPKYPFFWNTKWSKWNHQSIICFDFHTWRVFRKENQLSHLNQTFCWIKDIWSSMMLCGAYVSSIDAISRLQTWTGKRSLEIETSAFLQFLQKILCKKWHQKRETNDRWLCVVR